MARTQQKATARRTLMLFAVTKESAEPIWVTERETGVNAALAEMIISKLQAVRAPIAVVLCFDGKPRDQVIDFVGNLISLLQLRNEPQGRVMATGQGELAAFLWRNQGELRELQAHLSDDPAFGPGLQPESLLNECSVLLSKRLKTGKGELGLEALWPALAREPEIGHSRGSAETKQRRRRRRKVEQDEVEQSAKLEVAMREIIATLPGDYLTRRDMLARLSDAFRGQVSAALQRPLNERLATMPQETYEEKQQLVLWLNSELRRFGLAIKCPKTGRASLLQADAGRHPALGRFQTDNVDEAGKRVRPLSFNELVPLEFMPDDLSRASWGKWAGGTRQLPERRGGKGCG